LSVICQRSDHVGSIEDVMFVHSLADDVEQFFFIIIAHYRFNDCMEKFEVKCAVDMAWLICTQY